MPLARLPEITELVAAMFAPELGGSQKESPPKRFIFANLVDHMACEGLSQDLPGSCAKCLIAARNEVARVLHQVATAMERPAEMLRTQFNTPVLFVSPPGMLNMESAVQQIVYMLTEVNLAMNIDFYMCAPYLRVGQDDLRPAALSIHAYLAALSRLLQTLGRNGNAQLMWDDAINYDHGKRLGHLTFDEEGNRLLPDATLTERENMR